MIAKQKEHTLAVKLRLRGYSYSEILREVSVAKSTLSLWLKYVSLSKKQHQRLTHKKRVSALKGAQKRREIRLVSTRKIKTKSISAVGSLTDREFWLLGAALYWAEGSKEKSYRPSESVIFSNSDPKMIRFFIKWLKRIGISRKKIVPEIYIHKTHRNKLSAVIRFWSEATGFNETGFKRIYFKKANQKSLRKNAGESYNGLLRLRVLKSVSLNREIAGWVDGICLNCGVV